MKKLSILVGEVLYHAQQELSSYGNGTFIKWAESKGIKKASVYNYINAYKFVQQLDKPEDKETFLAQPKTLQYAMSKTSAKDRKFQGKNLMDRGPEGRKGTTRDIVGEATGFGSGRTYAQLQSQVEQAQRSESIARKQRDEVQQLHGDQLEAFEGLYAVTFHLWTTVHTLSKRDCFSSAELKQSN